MKLSNIFKMNTTKLREAIAGGDVAAVETLRGKRDPFLSIIMTYDRLDAMTQPVTDVFVNKFTEQDWYGWGFKSSSREDVLNLMFLQAIESKRVDLFDTFLNSDLDFNRGKASAHPLQFAATVELPEDIAVDLVRRLLAKQTDKVENRESILASAARAGHIGVFNTLLTAFGVDIHKNNEELLRVAAEAGKRDFCQALVESHNAGLDVAITTSRTLGQQDVAQFLDDLRLEINPGQKAPPTIESLSAEVDQLRGLVRDLSAGLRQAQVQLSEIQSPKPLEKPQLPRPQTAFKTVP